MLYRFNQFIKESIQKDKIKDYFYDLIDSGVEYNFNPLLDGGFYIILFNYHNINDGEVKNGKISETFIESLISRINDMENLNLTYSIMQRNINSRETNVVIIFDSYFIEHFRDLFKDLKIIFTSKGETIFSKDNQPILSHSGGLLSVIDALWVKMIYQGRSIVFDDAIISRIMYEEYGLKVNFVNHTKIIPPINNDRLIRMLRPPRYIPH